MTFVLSIWLAPKLCLELGKYNNFLRKTRGIDDFLYIWGMEKKEVATVRKGGVSANADREHPEAINDNRDGCQIFYGIGMFIWYLVITTFIAHTINVTITGYNIPFITFFDILLCSFISLVLLIVFD